LADTIGFSDLLLELDEVILSLDYCMSKSTPMSRVQSQSMNFEHRESALFVVRSRLAESGLGGGSPSGDAGHAPIIVTSSRMSPPRSIPSTREATLAPNPGITAIGSDRQVLREDYTSSGALASNPGVIANTNVRDT